VQVREHYFMFSIFYIGIVGTGDVRAADMLGSKVSGIDCEECHVIAVLCDVT
jgi:hypothetical protein